MLSNNQIQKVFLFVALVFIGMQSQALNYYWVGNSGSWNDPTHWALSDGGSPQGTNGCAPTLNDSVFFTVVRWAYDRIILSNQGKYQLIA